MQRPASPNSSCGAWLVAGAVAAIQTLRLLYFAQMPPRELVQRIPDDAFYYLVLARNFASSGRWTFDGAEPASGFQLLWGYMLAAIYRVLPHIGLRGVFLAAGALQILAMADAVWLVCRTARRIFGAGAEAGVAVVAFAAVSLMVNISLMETSLVLLVSAAVLDQLTETKPLVASRWNGIAVGVAQGVIGSLARVDFALLPLCLLAMQLALWRLRLADASRSRQAFAICAGAAAGVGLIALHTHAISGLWMQASVHIKMLWSDVPSLSPVRFLLTQFFNPADDATGAVERVVSRPRVYAVISVWIVSFIAIVALGLLLRCLRWAIHEAGPRLAVRAIVTVGLCATIATYAALYGWSAAAATQEWYIGQFEMPLALLVGGGWSFYMARARWAALAVCGLMCMAGVYNSLGPSYYWQQSMYDAAVYVEQRPELAPVGAWNAGIMGYFNPGQVVNLDGLVNDRILGYLRSGRLVDYVAQRRLHTIFDYPMVFAPIVARRGNYNDGALRRCLTEQAWPNASEGDPTLQRLTLYRVDAPCLSHP